ncbi:MAG TPA: GNAT family protein [Rickettsiales bacterium]|nr:GNAT family protein [Rickettsiales bacterium]
MKQRIKSKRIFIEKVSAESKVELFNLVNNSRSYLKEWLIWVDSINSIEDEEKAIKKMEDSWKNNKKYSFVIKEKISNKLIGMISVIKIYKYRKKCEIGYWLGNEYTRNGFMAEAINILEKEIFSEGFLHILIQCNEKNKKSVAVAKRNEYKKYFSKTKNGTKYLFFRKIKSI